jgi:hypothetical protein
MRPAHIRVVLTSVSLAAFVVVGAGCLAPTPPRDPMTPYVDPLDDHAAWSPGESPHPSSSGLRTNL